MQIRLDSPVLLLRCIGPITFVSLFLSFVLHFAEVGALCLVFSFGRGFRILLFLSEIGLSQICRPRRSLCNMGPEFAHRCRVACIGLFPLYTRFHRGQSICRTKTASHF